jgi:hypothetical protein
MLWAAMEAEAFGSADIDHLLDVGLAQIPGDSLIAKLIGDVRAWHKANPDWRDTRQKIQDNYGYDKYPGNCHVVPNHALMVMSVLYAPQDFQKAQMIVNTSGWDTDCNAGNVGCLMGIMNGLEGLDEGPDWRGPIADRMLISSADGGNSINDAVKQAYYLTNLGLTLAGGQKLDATKNGAQFHFSLPGSQQGFRPQPSVDASKTVRIGNAEFEGSNALAIDYEALGPGQVASATTPTFSPREMLDMRTYDLMATPLVYPGQKVSARVKADKDNRGSIDVRLRIRVYNERDELTDIDGDVVSIAAGSETVLGWTLPDTGGQPIAEIGIAITGSDKRADGRLLVDYLRWDGAPALTLRRPTGDGDFWRMSWVNGASFFSKRFPQAFRIAQNVGEGIIIHGTRQWTDYEASGDVMMHLGNYGGMAVRAQGLRRFYGARVTRDGKMQIVRVRDEDTKVLAETDFKTEFETPIAMKVAAKGNRISFTANGTSLSAEDDSAEALADGGIGLLVHEGALSSNEIRIGAA